MEENTAPTNQLGNPEHYGNLAALQGDARLWSPNPQNMSHYFKKFAKSLLPKPVKKVVMESLRHLFIPPVIVQNLLAHDRTFVDDVLVLSII